MIRFKLSLLVFALFSLALFSQTLKSPSDFLGYELGSAFSRHHQVVDYFKHVAAEKPAAWLTGFAMAQVIPGVAAGKKNM